MQLLPKFLRSPRPDSLLGMAAETVRELFTGRVMQMSAALAFWSALSLAPLVVITLGVAGTVIDREHVQARVMAEAGRVLGQDGAQLIATVANDERRTGAGGMAAVAGAIALLFGATAVFGQLQEGLNAIWDVKAAPRRRGLWPIVRKRLLSLAMVVSLGFLLLISLLVSAALTALTERLASVTGAEGALGHATHLVVSLLATTLLFALIFRLLPDARIAWREVWRGALVTAVLFHAGEWAIGQYLGRAGVGSAYGAAGALIVLLVWVYYSSAIVFAGAEFTQVWATRRGHGIVPEAHARRARRTKPLAAPKPVA